MSKHGWIAIGACVFGMFAVRPAMAVVAPSQPAQQDAWTFELTPYIWGAGIDADVKVNGQTTHVNQKFKDIVKNVDAAGELMGVANYNRWQLFAQADYFSLSDDGSVDVNGATVNGEVDSDTFILTAAGGYTFDGFVKDSTITVLGGLRYLNLDNTIKAHGIGSAESTSDITDAIVMLRPSFQLSEKWRFNPTMDVGAGDSDLTWELQPQFQYQFTKDVAGRIGYRRLHYKEEADHDSQFDGSFTGFILGLGITL